MNDPIHIPSFILEIIEKLEKNGFEAYLVGGVIRDHMLGTSTKDYDISSSATPNQIKKVFKNNKFLDYGEKHGTISILYKQEVIEITTFREETSYSDGRRPDKINFIKDLRSDLSRRDFTINAMAATKDGNIIDYFGGKNDFKAKIIRTVGEAVERFSEDSLRMFRAIRFAVRLNFSIEKETFDAIKQNANLIIRHKISSERITGELLEILRFPKQGIQYLDNSNLLHVLMPEIYSNNTIEQIRKFNIPEKTNFAEFGFAILLSQIRSTSMRNSILSRFLGLNKKQVFSIYQLSQHSVIPTDIIEHPTKAMIRRWLTKTTKEFNGNRASLNQEDYLYLLFDLIKLQHHDNDLIEIINKIQIASYNLLSILNTQLAINGKVVESFGYKGRIVGTILEYLKIIANRDLLADQELIDVIRSFNAPIIIYRDVFINKITEGIITNTKLEKIAIFNELNYLYQISKYCGSKIIIVENSIEQVIEVNFDKSILVTDLDKNLLKSLPLKYILISELLLNKSLIDNYHAIHLFTTKIKNVEFAKLLNYIIN